MDRERERVVVPVGGGMVWVLVPNVKGGGCVGCTKCGMSRRGWILPHTGAEGGWMGGRGRGGSSRGRGDVWGGKGVREGEIERAGVPRVGACGVEGGISTARAGGLCGAMCC